MSDMCRVALTGRLTRDAELRHTAGGTAVAGMRLAYSTRQKDASGQWNEKSNYIDLTMFGTRAEAIVQYLTKGKQLGVDGRLEWREWEAKDGTGKRQAYEVIVDDLVLLGGRDDGQSGGGGGSSRRDDDDFVPAGAGSSDDDIPF